MGGRGGILLNILVIPFALGMGAVRGIPFTWRLIDGSFGVFGAIPLLVCRAYIRRVEVLVRAGQAPICGETDSAPWERPTEVAVPSAYIDN